MGAAYNVKNMKNIGGHINEIQMNNLCTLHPYYKVFSPRFRSVMTGRAFHCIPVLGWYMNVSASQSLPHMVDHMRTMCSILTNRHLLLGRIRLYYDVIYYNIHQGCHKSKDKLIITAHCVYRDI